MNSFSNDIIEHKVQSNDLKYIFYLDFDGTLTNMAGNKLVYSETYKMMMSPCTYESAFYPLGHEKTVCQNIKQMIELDEKKVENNEITEEKKIINRIGLSLGVREFLKELLKLKNEYYIEINIISRNRLSYIKGMLLFYDFSEEEIKSINIHTSGKKNEIIQKLSRNHIEERPNILNQSIANLSFSLFSCEEKSNIALECKASPIRIMVCDDSKTDFALMKNQSEQIYGVENVCAFNAKAGKFDWQQILELVKKEYEPTITKKNIK